MINLLAYQRQTITYTGTILDSDGDPVSLAADDYLRCKIGRRNAATPDLDMVSASGVGDGTATVNGSSISITSVGDSSNAATYTLVLAQADLAALIRGACDIEIIHVDNSVTTPTDPNVPVDQGVLHVLGGLAGNQGVPS